MPKPKQKALNKRVVVYFSIKFSITSQRSIPGPQLSDPARIAIVDDANPPRGVAGHEVTLDEPVIDVELELGIPQQEPELRVGPVGLHPVDEGFHPELPVLGVHGADLGDSGRRDHDRRAAARSLFDIQALANREKTPAFQAPETSLQNEAMIHIKAVLEHDQAVGFHLVLRRQFDLHRPGFEPVVAFPVRQAQDTVLIDHRALQRGEIADGRGVQSGGRHDVMRDQRLRGSAGKAREVGLAEKETARSYPGTGKGLRDGPRPPLTSGADSAVFRVSAYRCICIPLHTGLFSPK